MVIFKTNYHRNCNAIQVCTDFYHKNSFSAAASGTFGRPWFGWLLGVPVTAISLRTFLYRKKSTQLQITRKQFPQMYHPIERKRPGWS